MRIGKIVGLVCFLSLVALGWWVLLGYPLTWRVVGVGVFWLCIGIAAAIEPNEYRKQGKP